MATPMHQLYIHNMMVWKTQFTAQFEAAWPVAHIAIQHSVQVRRSRFFLNFHSRVTMPIFLYPNWAIHHIRSVFPLPLFVSDSVGQTMI